MCKNEDNGVLAWHATESLATWVEYAYQLKKYLLKDSTKRVFVYGREDEKPVEYKRVTHGRWLSVKLVDEADFEEVDGAECSVCGGTFSSEYWAKTFFKYCPYCGNPLDEVEE